MSKKELVLVASRAFALLLGIWALTDLMYLPERLFSLHHHSGPMTALNAAPDYWGDYYLLATAMLILRVLMFLLAAVVFWKCGPRVQRLFGEDETLPGN